MVCGSVGYQSHDCESASHGIFCPMLQILVPWDFSIRMDRIKVSFRFSRSDKFYKIIVKLIDFSKQIASRQIWIFIIRNVPKPWRGILRPIWGRWCCRCWCCCFCCCWSCCCCCWGLFALFFLSCILLLQFPLARIYRAPVCWFPRYSAAPQFQRSTMAGKPRGDILITFAF